MNSRRLSVMSRPPEASGQATRRIAVILLRRPAQNKRDACAETPNDDLGCTCGSSAVGSGHGRGTWWTHRFRKARFGYANRDDSFSVRTGLASVGWLPGGHPGANSPPGRPFHCATLDTVPANCTETWIPSGDSASNEGPLEAFATRPV